jgi:chemotaxis-related protein WspD
MSDDIKKVDDCWNQIGVWSKSNRSCDRLPQYVHCANCPVFSLAGRQLLNNEPPEGYLNDWAEFLSVEQKEKERNTSSVIMFRLGDEWFGMPSALVDEVVPMRPIHRIPHRRNGILRGLVTIRGELQICVSMGGLLNISRGEISGTNVIKGIYERLMIISLKGAKYAFPVSEIKGVQRFGASAMIDAPATSLNCSVHFLKGMLVVDNKHVGVIDQDLLFSALDRGIL